MNQVVSKLKTLSQNNPTARSVFTLWALRKRARNTVTVASLASRMREEGFSYSKAQYQDLLKTLFSMGVGKLDMDAKGRVRGLKDIKLTLQSIGLAAVGQQADLRPSKTKNRFQHLPTTPEPVATAPTVRSKVIITVLINDKAINMPMPPDLTAEEMGTIISRLQEGRGKEV